MRLNRLDLARFGRFTDHVIDFGKPAAGQPDLHIVYGPNEAGKSTAFAAFLDLLFGIEARSRFNFVHPYSAMRISASLETAEGARELVRIKRPQKSLLDGNDRPVTEAVIQNELGGLDRDAYRAMFSLDDDTLEEGGENILASRGDLGELLFSASTGLADLSRALVDLRTEADGFYKYRAKSGELQDLKTQLADLKTQRERIDIFAAEYAQLVAQRERARGQYEEVLAERGRIAARRDELQRHLSALPRLAALRAIREKLQPLAGLRDAPLGWLKDLPKLQTEEIELTTRMAAVEAEIEQVAAELQAIAVDDAALRFAGRVDDLADRRARYITAEKDLPERRLQLQQAGFTVDGLLKRLGRPEEADPTRLILGAPAIGALRGLIETRSGVEASVDGARRELAEAAERHEDARARQQDIAGGPNAGRKREAQIAALSAAVATLRASDHAARLRFAERACKTHRDALAEKMAALRPWAGNDDQLADLSVPDAADIERWKEALAQANRQIDRHENEIERLEAERRRVKAELDTISRVSGVVSEHDAASVRTEREEAWAHHRRQLDEASATSFEAALRRDDIVVNAQLRHEKEIAQLHQASAALALVEADLKHNGERLNAALASRRTVHEELASVLLAMTPRLPDFALGQLEVWLGRRERALEARASLKQAERDLQEAEADIAGARVTLSNVLEALAVPMEADAGYDALFALAQSTVEQETELKALRVAVQDREREMKARERALRKASEADDAWGAAWAEACAGCWLGDGGKTPAVATVREILAALGELAPALLERSGFTDRIRKMEKDQADFSAEVSAVAQALDLGADGGEALDVARQITERLQQARIAEAAKVAKGKALNAARARQRDLAEALAIHARRKADMTAFFEVETLADAAGKLQEIARKAELQSQAGDAARDILDALRAPSIEAAEAALDAADRPAIEQEAAELNGRFEDQDQRVQSLFAEHNKAADRVEAVGGDSAAAVIEERRRTVLLDIEERALRYLRLRVGIVAAEQALHIYRDKHRSSMMARASGAFQNISRSAYRGLATQLDKDSEILIAVAADGASKLASELSKGTRFQLYLALRVAGYYEFAEARRPVPFIADDIMETFDEFRAEETFKVFAEMARIGQVIYLTHHRHLCDIARSICPAVRIHDLTAIRPRTEAMTSAA